MRPVEDLREWIEQAKAIGELTVIEGADTHLEIGTLSQVVARNQGPAVLHDKIKGYPAGFRVLTNSMSNIKTFNLTFGLALDYAIKDSVEALRTRITDWERQASSFQPKFVDKAPILENVVQGDKIDLNIFPVPFWHELDGGPYIGTADSVITRDPDTGQVNYGTYRSQRLDGQSVGMMVTHGHQGRLHRDKYFDRGEPCPVAMVFGHAPLFFGISAASIPEEICELNYIGAIIGEPVEVIKGRVTGLPIPANAEIAIEGFVDPAVTKKEGRFGEWQGYYAGSVTDQPFLKPTALYYRNNPILLGSPPAKGLWNDAAILRSVLRSALIYNEIVASGVPGVKGVWCPPAGGVRYLQVISIKQMYGGHATHAGHAAVSSRTGAFAGRYTIIVDDDVNPYDMEDVIWAVATRSLPSEADLLKKTWGSHSEPLFHRPTSAAVDSTPSRAIIYAVKPYEWKDEFAPVNLASEADRKLVFDRWKGKFKDRLQTT
jgi:4-hydroxy-3-polyprenylbenzoate decarboxylase